jgi:hypothetical protein
VLNIIEYLNLDQCIFARLSFILNLDFIYDHNNKIIQHIDKP